MKKTGSIKTKLIIINILTVLVPVFIVITVTSIKLKDDAIHIAKIEAKKIAETYSNKIRLNIANSFNSLNTYAAFLNANFDENGISELSKDKINTISTHFLSENKRFSSVFVTYLPNHFYKKDEQKINTRFGTFTIVREDNGYGYFDSWLEKLNFEVIGHMKNNNGYILTEPYTGKYKKQSRIMISYGKAVYINNDIVGAVGVDIDINWIQKYISNSNIFNSEAQVYIVSDGGYINADNENSKNVGKQAKNVIVDFDIENDFKKENSFTKQAGIYKFVVPINFENLNKSWYVIIKVPEKNVLKNTYSVLFKRIALVVLLMIVAFAIAYIYTTKLTKRLCNIATTAQQIANGNLDVSFNVVGNDEIEKLGNALQIMADKFYEIIKSINIASADLYKSGSVLSDASIKLSEGAAEQAASTEAVSASMQQLNANIEQNADNSKQADKMTKKSANDIEISSKTVVETVKAMNNVAEEISIIGDIAFQTNILALNASVEAAKAGKYGKGFGVVAKEVGKLASNSKIAANKINTLTKKSTQNATTSGKLLKAIVPDIKKTATLVQEITNASFEQRSGTNEINNAIQELNKVTQENLTSAEQLTNNVKKLNSHADKLSNLIDFFKIDKKNRDINDFENTEIKTYNNSEEVDTNSDIETKKNTEIINNNLSESYIAENKIKTKETDIGYNLELGNYNEDDEFESF